MEKIRAIDALLNDRNNNIADGVQNMEIDNEQNMRNNQVLDRNAQGGDQQEQVVNPQRNFMQLVTNAQGPVFQNGNFLQRNIPQFLDNAQQVGRRAAAERVNAAAGSAAGDQQENQVVPHEPNRAGEVQNVNQAVARNNPGLQLLIEANTANPGQAFVRSPANARNFPLFPGGNQGQQKINQVISNQPNRLREAPNGNQVIARGNPDLQFLMPDAGNAGQAFIRVPPNGNLNRKNIPAIHDGNQPQQEDQVVRGDNPRPFQDFNLNMRAIHDRAEQQNQRGHFGLPNHMENVDAQPPGPLQNVDMNQQLNHFPNEGAPVMRNNGNRRPASRNAPYGRSNDDYIRRRNADNLSTLLWSLAKKVAYVPRRFDNDNNDDENDLHQYFLFDLKTLRSCFCTTSFIS